MPKPITKEQRKALKRIYDRRPIWKDGTSAELAMKAGWKYVAVADLAAHHRPANKAISMIWIHGWLGPIFEDSDTIVEHYKLSTRCTYKEFRRSVQQGFDCLMVQWAGMWLGVEKDGYVHS